MKELTAKTNSLTLSKLLPLLIPAAVAQLSVVQKLRDVLQRLFIVIAHPAVPGTASLPGSVQAAPCLPPFRQQEPVQATSQPT